MERGSYGILHPLRVRWNECDMHGIVFNVNYFLYYDIAVYEWQRAVSEGIPELPDFITVHAECDYLLSAHFDENIEIGVRCTAIGSKSLDLETAIFRGSQLLNRGKLTYAHVTKGTTRTSPIGADLIERIVSFERMGPLIRARPLTAADQTPA